MVHTLYDGLDEIAFRPFVLWYLSKCALLIGLGGTCLWLAMNSARLWWAGVVLAFLAALVLVARYNAQAVIIRSSDLVLRTGTLKARERIFPIWQVDLELDQSLLGRLFDYATIRLRVAGGVLVVPTIASARALRFLVAQRRQSALQWEMLSASRQLPHRPRSLPEGKPSR
jgi:uncharacterized membrane protein YdbT with pleckstrin-like domain